MDVHSGAPHIIIVKHARPIVVTHPHILVVEVILPVSSLSCLLFLDLGGIGEALFVDLPLEGVSLVLVDLGLGLEHSLFLMHFCFILEDTLVNDLILPLLSLKSLRVALVVLQLLHHCSPRVEGSHGLVLDLDGAQLALVYQLLILGVSHLALLASLQLSITVFLNHGSVGVQILSLQLDFFELLGQSLFLRLLILLLFRYLFVYFNKTLVLSCLDLSLVVLLLFLLLSPLGFILESSKLTSLMNFSSLIHDLFDAILLCFKVVFSLGSYLLLSQHLVIFKTLSELSDGHFI